MDDVERLFDKLVEALSEQDPAGLHKPFQVSELYQSIVPYRRYRNQLQFDTNQDYEMAVLRLLAGEGGYVAVEPGEVQRQLAEEVRAINPDPGIFRDYAAARVLINASAVRGTISRPDSYAPPREAEPISEPAASHQASPEPGAPPWASEVSLGTSIDVPQRADPDTCPQCSTQLPRNREVSFCPFCGSRVQVSKCARCGGDIEPGWRFCVDCGEPATTD
jgi:hypothetical protein